MLYYLCHCKLYVTGPVKINHVNAITLSYIFAYIFHSECSISFLYIVEESPINSTVLRFCCVSVNSYLLIFAGPVTYSSTDSTCDCSIRVYHPFKSDCSIRVCRHLQI